MTGTKAITTGGWGMRMRTLLAGLAFALVAGCATTGGGDPRDPLEGINRSIYSFNEGFDAAIGRPVASTYKAAVPEPVRTWVRNFFANIDDVFIGVNNMLQGKIAAGWTDWVRFVFNTTIGLAGINDVASEMGLEKHNEDFGQTFGRWGMGDGAYIVLPFFGSSTARDTAGRVLDIYFDPVRKHEPSGVRTFASLLRATSKRADLLDASRILEEAALDKYVFERDAYLQRRRALIFDGTPPRTPSSRLREEPRADRAVESPTTVARTHGADQVLEAPAALAAAQDGR